MNCWFHKLTRCQYNNLYNDGWLELVAILVCFLFTIVRLIQFIKKVFWKSIKILLFLDSIIFFYILFEMFSINYTSILIEGKMEASYPFSTTLFIMCAMSTLWEQFNRTCSNNIGKWISDVMTILFSIYILKIFNDLLFYFYKFLLEKRENDGKNIS